MRRTASTIARMPLPECDWSLYDFIDLGCSRGGSIEHCMSRFGATRGLGLDTSPRKVEQTRTAGYDAIVGDARELDLDGAVSFVSMLDFCEHLPSARVVEDVLAAAARSARDFLYIKHPSFEGKELAESLGVRQYWWDWHGHTAHVRVADYCTMLERIGLANYCVRFLGRIDDSTHATVIPTTMPPDRLASDAAAITDVPFVRFSPPLWRRQDIFIALRPFTRSEWARIIRPTAADAKAMAQSGETEHRARAYAHVAPARDATGEPRTAHSLAPD